MQRSIIEISSPKGNQSATPETEKLNNLMNEVTKK